jgi:hypothetical protein
MLKKELERKAGIFAIHDPALKVIDQVMKDTDLPKRKYALLHIIMEFPRIKRKLDNIARAAKSIERKGGKILLVKKGKPRDITRIVEEVTKLRRKNV